MRKPIFHFDKLKPFDLWTIGLYLLLTLGLYVNFKSTLNITSQPKVIFFYAIGTQLFLYMFCYKSLRNLTTLFIWIAIGFLHLYFYFNFKDDITLQMLRGHATTPLRNTIPLLVLQQVFRIVSIKIQNQEFVSPWRRSKDLFDGREGTLLDFILFFMYCGCVIVFD